VSKNPLPQIRWTRLAAADLEQAVDWLASESPAAAKKFVGAIDSALVQLVAFPGLGRSGRVAGTREWLMPDWPFVIPYRFYGGDLEILRIYHTSRIWPPRD
jgi:plasmid stabilization system protein ParE